MRLTVIATDGHQGKELEVDCDRENITVLGSTGEFMGTISWGSLISFIKSSSEEGLYENARSFPRAPLAIKVHYTTEEGKQFESLTGGVGGGGLFIESSAPLPPGSEITVDFSLPDRPTERMKAKGRVAWVRGKVERHLLFPGMGIQFTDIDEKARGRVQELVDALTRSRLGV